MNNFEKTSLVNNIVGHLKNAKKPLQEKMIAIFTKADKEYGARVAEGLRKASSEV
jgi:catalase